MAKKQGSRALRGTRDHQQHPCQEALSFVVALAKRRQGAEWPPVFGESLLLEAHLTRLWATDPRTNSVRNWASKALSSLGTTLRLRVFDRSKGFLNVAKHGSCKRDFSRTIIYSLLVHIYIYKCILHIYACM